MKTEKEKLTLARSVAAEVAASGGRAYYVGGYVRDLLLGKDSTDIDIEVHGVAPRELKRILSAFGEIKEMGESFGIYSVKGFDVDFAMPRSEIPTGRGHRDFEISVGPFIGPEKAAERRDFTVNAMMQDILSGEILDFFGGKKDLQTKTLRCVSGSTFSEDALRVLRCAQFAARFGFSVDEKTADLCRNIPLDKLARERVFAELEKALMKSAKPSVFFEVLRSFSALDFWFPEARDLIGVKQTPYYHPEGDVWNHTMLVLDNAAAFRSKAERPLGFMMAALTHDFGKPASTTCDSGAYHSYGHEVSGQTVISAFIGRLTSDKALTSYVANMTILHMKPNIIASARPAVKSTNHLFDSALFPEDLLLLAYCDAGPDCHEKEKNREFLDNRLRVYREYMNRPFVSGKDLVAAGLKPDGNFSSILAYAHKLRLAGVPKPQALKSTLSYAAQYKNKGDK